MAVAACVRPRTFFVQFIAGLAACLIAAVPAKAQRAEETARQRIWLKAYGLFSYVDADYMGDRSNKGITIGGDLDALHPLPRTKVGLDARYAYSSGREINEEYFGGGPRVSLQLGRFQPYGDFIFGGGKGFFNHPVTPTYTQDVSKAFAYGGGVDFAVTHGWALRADVQKQTWRFSHLTPYFYPVAASVGVSYQFHFHGRTGPDL